MIKDESVLSRWSRRKLQSDQQTLKEDLGIALQQQNSPVDVPAQGINDITASQDEQVEPLEVLTDADMPNIDSLHEDSDFSGFMSPGVSDELRKLALKKLFQTPSFNICDGLDEYDEDYTTFEKLGDIITCDMKHQLELEAEEKLQQAQQSIMDDEEANELPAETGELPSQQEMTTQDELLTLDNEKEGGVKIIENDVTPTDQITDNFSQEKLDA